MRVVFELLEVENLCQGDYSDLRVVESRFGNDKNFGSVMMSAETEDLKNIVMENQFYKKTIAETVERKGYYYVTKYNYIYG